MDLDSNLLKEFAKMTNDSEVKQENKYLRGTIVKTSGGKFVQLDGSTTVTPISEIIDVDEGDRVLVTIENHKATIVGNFSFPPSARKEQEAIDKADAAQGTADQAGETANAAQIKAKEASDKANEAMGQSSIASASANEAKQQATEALNKANSAQANIQEAKDLATQANTNSTEAKNQAAQSQASSAEAQAKVIELQNEVNAAKEDINKALEDLESQGEEITVFKETYSTKVETDKVKAELSTEIDVKVGSLQTTIEENYSTKTENVELEGRLQTQITQNAEGFASQATKIEKLEGDTADAQKDVENALAQATAAQSTATEAQTKAQAAQDAANAATADANSAAQKAQLAQNAADAATAAANAADQAVQQAQGDLDEAKQNLATVTSRVDATEAEIAEAQQKVDAAQESVNEALADAAEARLAADNATEAATKAQQDAETAQGTANAAQQKADNAKTAADNAQAAADKAQEDVAALTSRVTTAETKIEQNNEAISLNASKTEEIGDKLQNDYYSKTETDAKFEVTSESITSTVKRVEDVEKDFDNLEVGGRNYISYGRGNTLTGYFENFDTIVDDDYAQLTLSATTNTHKSISINPGFLLKARDYEPGKKIVYSYDIMFTQWDIGEGAELGEWWMGQRYSSDPTGVATEGAWRKVTMHGLPKVGVNCELNEWVHVSLVMTIPEPAAEGINTETIIKMQNKKANTNISITMCMKNVKIEYGNTETDWSPAPEDAEEKINDAKNTADNAQTTADNANSIAEQNQISISEAYSMIQQLANSLGFIVEEQDDKTVLTQTKDGWSFTMQQNITDLNTSNAALNKAQSEMTTNLESINKNMDEVKGKTAYVTISQNPEENPYIELGKEGNKFKVRITNTAIDFLEDSAKLAYANNKAFYAEKMIVKNELQIGTGPGFVWKTRANGNMGLVYIKG